MTNLTSISHKPSPEIIEMLEHMLERAKRGEISNIVMAYELPAEGAYGYRSYVEDRWRALGAIEYARAGVFESIMSDRLPTNT